MGKRILEHALQSGQVARYEAEAMGQQCENHSQNGYHQNRDQREELCADGLSRKSPIDEDGRGYYPVTAVSGAGVEAASASSFHDNPCAVEGQMGTVQSFGHESTRVTVVQPSERAHGSSGRSSQEQSSGRGERDPDWTGEADTAPRDKEWQNSQRTLQVSEALGFSCWSHNLSAIKFTNIMLPTPPISTGYCKQRTMSPSYRLRHRFW